MWQKNDKNQLCKQNQLGKQTKHLPMYLFFLLLLTEGSTLLTNVTTGSIREYTSNFPTGAIVHACLSKHRMLMHSLPRVIAISQRLFWQHSFVHDRCESTNPMLLNSPVRMPPRSVFPRTVTPRLQVGVTYFSKTSSDAAVKWYCSIKGSVMQIRKNSETCIFTTRNKNN